MGWLFAVALGLQERRRALARSTSPSLRAAETGVTQHFTWRKAILGGVLAFGGLAVLAAAYTAMRLLGIGPVGTLVASGRLAERDRLILAAKRTTDLRNPAAWQVIATVTAGDDGLIPLFDATPPTDKAFYRARPATP